MSAEPLMINRILPIFVAVAVAAWLGGCNRPADSGPVAKDAGHDHDHEHHHHGPHQGHLMAIGDEEYHAEWTHDESGKVTFYILDAKAKGDVPIDAEEIKIDVKIGNNPPKTYSLVAVNPMGGKASAFEIVDKEFEALFDQLKSPGVVLTLHVNIGGKQFDEQVKEHEHVH
jgi:hypothetical protein